MLLNKNIVFYHPIFKLTIGGKEIESVATTRVIADRRIPSAVAWLTLPNVDGELSGSIKVGDEIKVEWGYSDVPEPLSALAEIFSGHVYELSEGPKIRVTAYDRLERYNQMTFRREFRKEKPAVIIKSLCAKLSLEVGNLPELPKMDRVVLNNISLSAAISNIENWFRKNGNLPDGYAHFIDADGKLQWGDVAVSVNPPPPMALEIDGSLITSGEFPAVAGNVGTIKTIPLPWLKHSTILKIADGRFSKTSSEYHLLAVKYVQFGQNLLQEIVFHAI